MSPRQYLLLLSCANEYGWIASGRYVASQSPFDRGFRRGGFRGVSTACLLWTFAIIVLHHSHHPVHAIMLATSEGPFVLMASVPALLISNLVYADWNGSRSAALARWQQLPDDEKNLWVWCAVTYLTASILVFLAAVVWECLPTPP